MNGWTLPTTVTLCGKEYPIRSDYRAVLAACAALQDGDLNPTEKQMACLAVLYPNWQNLPDKAEAVKQAFLFINLGKEDTKGDSKPPLVDWEHDAQLIAPSVDKVLGKSCRSMPYLHWWEFVGAYMAVGEGLFATVVSIRHKKQKGKKLEKWEKEFCRDNPDLIALPAKKLTEADEEFLKSLGL